MIMAIRSAFTFGLYYGWASLRRGLVYSILIMLMPLSFLFIFGILSFSSATSGFSSTLLPYALVGGFISIVAGSSLETMSDGAFLRIELKFQDLIIATKMSMVDYMLGLGISNAIFAIPGIAIYAILASFFNIFTPITMLITILLLIVLTLCTTAIAFLLSTIPSHSRNVWGLTSILSLAFTIIPPIFYPYTILPKPLLYLLLISPATSAAVFMQGLTGLAPFNINMLYILLAETAIYFLIAKRFAKWRQD